MRQQAAEFGARIEPGEVTRIVPDRIGFITGAGWLAFDSLYPALGSIIR